MSSRRPVKFSTLLADSNLFIEDWHSPSSDSDSANLSTLLAESSLFREDLVSSSSDERIRSRSPSPDSSRAGALYESSSNTTNSNNQLSFSGKKTVDFRLSEEVSSSTRDHSEKSPSLSPAEPWSTSIAKPGASNGKATSGPHQQGNGTTSKVPPPMNKRAVVLGGLSPADHDEEPKFVAPPTGPVTRMKNPPPFRPESKNSEVDSPPGPAVVPAGASSSEEFTGGFANGVDPRLIEDTDDDDHTEPPKPNKGHLRFIGISYGHADIPISIYVSHAELGMSVVKKRLARRLPRNPPLELVQLIQIDWADERARQRELEKAAGEATVLVGGPFFAQPEIEEEWEDGDWWDEFERNRDYYEADAGRLGGMQNITDGSFSENLFNLPLTPREVPIARFDQSKPFHFRWMVMGMAEFEPAVQDLRFFGDYARKVRAACDQAVRNPGSRVFIEPGYLRSDRSFAACFDYHFPSSTIKRDALVSSLQGWIGEIRHVLGSARASAGPTVNEFLRGRVVETHHIVGEFARGNFLHDFLEPISYSLLVRSLEKVFRDVSNGDQLEFLKLPKKVVLSRKAGDRYSEEIHWEHDDLLLAMRTDLSDPDPDDSSDEMPTWPGSSRADVTHFAGQFFLHLAGLIHPRLESAAFGSLTPSEPDPLIPDPYWPAGPKFPKTIFQKHGSELFLAAVRAMDRGPFMFGGYNGLDYLVLAIRNRLADENLAPRWMLLPGELRKFLTSGGKLGGLSAAVLRAGGGAGTAGPTAGGPGAAGVGRSGGDRRAGTGTSSSNNNPGETTVSAETVTNVCRLIGGGAVPVGYEGGWGTRHPKAKGTIKIKRI